MRTIHHSKTLVLKKCANKNDSHYSASYFTRYNGVPGSFAFSHDTLSHLNRKNRYHDKAHSVNSGVEQLWGRKVEFRPEAIINK